MADTNKALATQVANIEKRTGKTIAELMQLVRASSLTRHGELVAMLKVDLGMGHGDANTVVHLARQSAGPAAGEGASSGEVLDALYTGPKASLRPIHDQLLAAMRSLGAFEEAPKKAYVSYRRKKQFCMIGPATNTRVELGLNVKNLPDDPRLLAQGAGKMCNYVVRLTDPAQVDRDVMAWVREAYQAAG